MKNLKVSAKLIVSFLLVVVLSLIIGAGGVYGILSMSASAESMYIELSEPLGHLTTAVEYFQRIRVQMQTTITYSGVLERLSTVETELNDRLLKFETAIEEYSYSLETPEEIALYDEIMRQYRDIMRPGVLDVLKSAKAGIPTLEHMRQSAPTTESANIIAGDLTTLVSARMKAMSDRNSANKTMGDMLLIMIIAVVLVCAAISMALAFYVAGLISKPLVSLTSFMNQASETGDIGMSPEKETEIRRFSGTRDETGQCIASTTRFLERQRTLAGTLESVAGGDLTVQLALLSDRDIMGVSLRKMVNNLSTMFADINRSTIQVAAGSKQIADGSQALAQGSTEQASAVEQLSSAIADISEKTKSNANLAAKAADLAGTIKQNAERGTRQMDEMTAAVREINEASQSISKVMKVIDDIAFQTNILALNAAVEAARAGQHGKGFAVVAEEVRSLASKSAEAAKDTGSLIANSMEKAALGARIVSETSASLTDIVAGINESGRLVGDIARSSEEQTAGIHQINNGIDQVAKVVQQNSATAEESAAASQEMSGQARLLEELVSQFRISKEGTGLGTQNAAQPARGRHLSMPEKISYAPGVSGYGKY